MVKQGFLFRALALSALLLGGPAQAVTTLSYQAKDLPDLVAGQDRWSYDYLLSGSFSAYDFVNLLYAAAGYADLALPPAPAPDPLAGLFAISLPIQPDPSFPADGEISLTALSDLTVTELPFTVEFTWFGSGSPGGQSFEILDGNFSVIGGGRTTPTGAPNVPEPASLLLVAGALGLLSWRRSRR